MICAPIIRTCVFGEARLWGPRCPCSTKLKPTQKFLVMDLLKEVGVDVSQWKNYKGNRPSANPKYCYNWSFEQPGEAVVVCLWHRGLKQGNGKIFFRRKPRAFASIRNEPGASVWNRRDADFGKHLELAYRQQLPIRVIVVEGDQRNPADLKPKASVVKTRLLDPVAWAVTEYDYATGECLLERGKKPVLPAADLAGSGVVLVRRQIETGFRLPSVPRSKGPQGEDSGSPTRERGKAHLRSAALRLRLRRTIRRFRRRLRPSAPPGAARQGSEGWAGNKAERPGHRVCELPRHDPCGRKVPSSCGTDNAFNKLKMPTGTKTHGLLPRKVLAAMASAANNAIDGVLATGSPGMISPLSK